MAAAEFSYKHYLSSEPGTVPAHQKMHPNQQALIKRQAMVH
jgi:hypothetical protein